MVGYDTSTSVMLKVVSCISIIYLIIEITKTLQFELSENTNQLDELNLFSEMKKQCGADPTLRQTRRKLVYQLDELAEFKKILIWSPFFNAFDFRFGLGTEAFDRNNCPVHQCYLTNNRSFFPSEEVDAVLRHFEIWNYDKIIRELPRMSRDVMNVFYSLEFPGTMDGVGRTEPEERTTSDRFRDTFNWTMTYRTDSDFRIPYGIIEPVEDDAHFFLPKQNYAENKTELAVWIASHCIDYFPRNILVPTLQQHMPVDVFGECGGSLLCPKYDISGCMSKIYGKYKFLFAFENTVCKDYITEKTFRTLQFNIVPVGFGLGYEQTGLPKKSYIDVLDFESVKHLASYLKYLDKNDTAYNEYFSWKKDYKVRGKFEMHRQAMCDLCAGLHQMDPSSPYGKDIDVQAKPPIDYQHMSISSLNSHTAVDIANRSPGYTKEYTDLYDWFVNQAECLTHRDNKAFEDYLKGATKTKLLKKYKDVTNYKFSFLRRPNVHWP